jgi:hypothetical protein
LRVDLSGGLTVNTAAVHRADEACGVVQPLADKALEQQAVAVGVGRVVENRIGRVERRALVMACAPGAGGDASNEPADNGVARVERADTPVAEL